MNEIVPEIQWNIPPIVKLSDPLFEKNDVELSMLRLDKIHPIVSGNKIFKLLYFLQEAEKSADRSIVTFGGAYSNHLAATAFACKELKIKSVGIVRGEKPKVLSATLLFCLQNEMKLEFISRSSYSKKNEDFFLKDLQNRYNDPVVIPEGGFSVKGMKGASLIAEYFNDKNFTHVCLPVGTATTFAGLVNGNKTKTEILGFSVLKNFNDLEKRFDELDVRVNKKYSLIGDYHFGGYAKRTHELISFMQNFHEQYKIALDFVYTAKMMFGVFDLVHKNYFPAGSKILCIHTGGLQGNSSLESD